MKFVAKRFLCKEKTLPFTSYTRPPPFFQSHFFEFRPNFFWEPRTQNKTFQQTQMAKAAPSKKTAKAAKSASGGKKAKKSKRTETFNSYIHKVLKQVHPGACPSPPSEQTHSQHTMAHLSPPPKASRTPSNPSLSTPSSLSNPLPFPSFPPQRLASPRRA